MKQSKRILLLSPNIIKSVFNQSGCLRPAPTLPPLGLGYLSAVLRRSGYKVKVIDCLGKSTTEIRRKVVAFKPHVVGISCFTEHRGDTLDLCRLVKSIDRHIYVVLGGSHATFNYKQLLLNYPQVDFCLLGETEKTFPLLLKQLFKKQPSFRKVPGLAFRSGKRVFATRRAGYIDDLDEIPFPDRSWIDPSQYRFPHPQGRDKKIAPVIASRGCPFGCQFCSTSQFWGKIIRLRSVKNIIAELDLLYKEKYQLVNFLDDTFTFDQIRIQALCEQMIKKKYGFLWCCATRVGMVSEKTARLMKKAGCFSINFGVESLSRKILKNINKKVSLKQTKQTFATLKKVGISSSCMLMIGNIGESRKTIQETIRNLAKFKPDSISTNFTLVFPGTPLYQISKKQKIH